MQPWLSTSLFYIAEAPAVLFLTLYLLVRYPTRLPGLGTPWYVYTTVGLAWFLSFLALILLPADLAETLFRRCEYLNKRSGEDLSLHLRNCAPPSLSPAALLATWQALYWTSLVLGWILLPLVQSNISLEHLPLRERVRKALRPQLIALAVLAVVLSALAAAVRSPRHHGLQLETWRATIIGLNNAFGLFLLMIFLGFGLVELPRTLWERSDPRRRLRAYAIRIAELHARHLETLQSLSRLRLQAAVLGIGCTDDQTLQSQEQSHMPGHARSATRAYRQELCSRIETLLNLVPLHSSDLEIGQQPQKTWSSTTPRATRMAESASLGTLFVEVRRAVLEYRRIEYLWQRISQRALFLQDLLQWRSAGCSSSAAASSACAGVLSTGSVSTSDVDRMPSTLVHACRAGESPGATASRMGSFHDAGEDLSPERSMRIVHDRALSNGDATSMPHLTKHATGAGAGSPQRIYISECERSVNAAVGTKRWIDGMQRSLALRWRAYGEPFCLRVQAVVLFIVASAVCLSELTIWTVLLTPPRSFSPFARALHSLPLSPLGVQAMALSLVCTLTSLVYFAVFHLQIYRWYELVPGYVDGQMLCLNAMLMSRFLLPLCYHLIFLLHENREAVARLLLYQYPQLMRHSGQDSSTVPVTAFETLMGSMHIVPLFGKAFNYFYPCSLVISALGTYFRLWGRLLDRFGLSRSLEFTEETISTAANNEVIGRQLLQRERARRHEASPCGLEPETRER